MISGVASRTNLQESGMVTPSKILQTLRFPGFAAFHRRVRRFRKPHNRDSQCTHCYTDFITIYRMYVRPKPHESTYACYVDCGIRPSHTYRLQSYHTIQLYVTGGRLPRVACLLVIPPHYDGRSLILLNPFLDPTPTCMVQHPEVRRDGSTLYGAYCHCLCGAYTKAVGA